jgi:putative cell wall-binding protein
MHSVPHAARPTSRLIALLGATAIAVFCTLLVPSAASAAGGATLTGTVTAADTSLPLEDVSISIFGSDGNYAPVSGKTDATGHFSAAGLSAGTYTVFFNTHASFSGIPAHYVSEWWSNQLFRSNATQLVVNDGDNVVLDASLTLGGSISGTITGQTTASGALRATAYTKDPGSGEWVYTVDALAEGGTYELLGLDPSLPYRVRFTNGGVQPHFAPEYYPDVTTIDVAQDVSVTSGGVTGNINAVLGPPRPIPSSRIAGDDRFATSAEVAKKYAPDPLGVVYVVNGLNYPDALSAAPAAAFRHAPLLLTQVDTLPAVVAEQIVRLTPKEIVVVGGTGVISDAVKETLQALVPAATVNRVAGDDRYETSRLVTEDAFGPTGAIIAWVATGQGFADALSAAAVAGGEGSPVILIDGTAPAVDAATASLLADLGTTDVFVAGGEAVVSEGMRASIENLPTVNFAARISGLDRYGTSLAVNRFRGDSSVLDTVYLAVGTGYADALAGAALAGRDKVPMFIVPGTCVPAPIRTELSDRSVGSLVLFGGPGVLTESVANLVVC